MKSSRKFINPKGFNILMETTTWEILSHISKTKGNASAYVLNAILKQMEEDGYTINGKPNIKQD